ncbi:unnamed protein product [Mytilus coruscus]|uniref:Reverse transcriptase domain-containing protein n=1 Tax=Mytilus coruscus TaxID=42192 RepID=A0A6J8C3Z8_MYTCO|nr:unnamed protein product [Mytilus coruscus]
MNIDRKYSEIDMTFKWETISKEKIYTVLEESSTRDEILGYENTPFEINCSGVERAEQQLNNIFKTLTMRSCKIIKSFRKKKLKKKKPWEDRELADVKKTVSNLAKLLRINPYNLNLRNNFLGHSLRDTDPKQYWKLSKSLKYENTNNKIELQAGFPEIIDHFKHQGETVNYDKEFETKIETDILSETDALLFNEVTDKPFTINEVNKCIQKLKTGKSSGPDRISNEIIKYSGVVTCKAITKLFNLILDSGKYPSNWRKSFTILIHKAGEARY